MSDKSIVELSEQHLEMVTGGDLGDAFHNLGTGIKGGYQASQGKTQRIIGVAMNVVEGGGTGFSEGLINGKRYSTAQMRDKVNNSTL